MQSFAAAALAIRDADPFRLEALLRAEPELVTARGDFQKTLLHEAAEVDELRAAQTLVVAGADLEARTSWGHSPLEWAATMGATRVGTFLIEHGATGLNLWTAAGLGHFEAVRAAFDSDGLADSAGQSRLRGARPDQWPAQTAFQRGDVVSDAFYTAARNGHLEIADFLFRAGADLDATGFFGATALHWAAHNGHQEMVEWLVRHGASLDRRDPKFDATPAEWAREGGHPQTAEFLLGFTRAGNPDP